MKSLLARSVVALVIAWSCTGLFASAKDKAHDETLVLSGQRRVSLTVPAGFLYASNKDERGLITTKLSDPKDVVSLQITFLPDTEGEFSTARGRKEMMVQSFQQYVAGSVEQGMRFEELEPRGGAGTYCVFTDAALVGKNKFPAGEYLHSTTGVKSWPGCIAVFTLLSNNTTSEEYQTAMKVLRESLIEPPLTPLR
jgi:hypothetical protein